MSNPSPYVQKRAAEKFGRTLVFSTVGVTLAASGVAGIVVGAHRAGHEEARAAVLLAESKNTFWAQVDGAELDSSPASDLASDLRPFLEDPGVESSGLLPTRLQDVYVAPGRYEGVEEDLGLDVFQGIDEADGDEEESSDEEPTIKSGGLFTPEFLNLFTLAQRGEFDQLQTEVPAAPAAPDYSFFPVVVATALFLSSLGGFVVAMARRRVDLQQGWSDGFNPGNIKLSGMAVPWKVATMVVGAPWVAISTLLYKSQSLRHRRAERRAQQEVVRQEVLRLKNNPFAEELLRAQDNLARLHALPSSPAVTKAIKNTQAVIKELEQAPLILSNVAAAEIADQIVRDNASLLDRPEALRRANEELRQPLRN